MSETFEAPTPHEHHLEHAAQHAHANRDHLASKIAVMTALLATYGAMLSYQAGSTEAEAGLDKNNAAISKTEASDQWGHYQAKSNRESLAELAQHLPGMDAVHYAAEVQRYRQEKEAIRQKAESFEAKALEWDQDSERALHQHHRWAQAMTAVQIAISLAAITLLTRRKWLQKAAYAVACVSVVLGAAAWLHL